MPIFVSEMKNDRMKRKISFLFLWLVLFGGLFFACNRKSFTDEEQKLRELVYHYPDSALRLLELAIDSPEVLKVSKSMWSYYHSQAKIIANMTDAQREAEAYSSKAVNHLVRGEDSLAMVYRWKSLNALKKDTVISDGTKKKIRNEIIQIGRLYTRKKQYDKAMEAYRACLKEPLSNNMFDDYLLPYLGIGEVYQGMGAYDSAMVYFQKALPYVDENPYWKSAIPNAIYRNFLLRGDTASAKQYHREMAKKGFYLEDSEPAYLKENVGTVYLGEKNKEEGKAYLYIIGALVMVLVGVAYVSFRKRRGSRSLLLSVSEPQADGGVSLEEALQQGVREFYASSWREKLETAEKEIIPGDYMKIDEQKQLLQELDTCFPAFINGLNEVCSGMSKEDVYYCILSHLDYRNRVIVYATRISSGALRTRKSRLKKSMPEEVFLLIFG